MDLMCHEQAGTGYTVSQCNWHSMVRSSLSRNIRRSEVLPPRGLRQNTITSAFRATRNGDLTGVPVNTSERRISCVRVVTVCYWNAAAQVYDRHVAHGSDYTGVKLRAQPVHRNWPCNICRQNIRCSFPRTESG